MKKTAPKKVLLFGGAFDPPHNGHIHLLENAMQTVQPDLVLVMPTGISPHKTASLTPAHLRKKMCGCFAALDERVRVSGFEIAKKGRSYTIDTLRWMQQKYPGAELVLSMGSDMLLSFQEWRSWQEILRIATLCCQSRADEKTAAVEARAQELRALGGRVELCPPLVLELSSTQVRAVAARGGDVSGLVPPQALAVIRENDLYHALPPAKTVARAVQANLSAKRWKHTQGVCRQAVSLARQYGADVQRAELAALLHDYMKETSPKELLQILSDTAIIKESADPPVPYAQRAPAAWHGFAAAAVLPARFGIRDEAILSAIHCHTCGKAGMSTLDKVLYLADMTSAERDFPGVERLRILCRQDLDTAMIHALRQTIDHVTSLGGTVDPESLAALQDLEAHKGEKT